MIYKKRKCFSSHFLTDKTTISATIPAMTAKTITQIHSFFLYFF